MTLENLSRVERSYGLKDLMTCDKSALTEAWLEDPLATVRRPDGLIVGILDKLNRAISRLLGELGL